MPFAAGIGAAGALGAAGISAYASSKASDQQAQQAQNALNFQQQVYGTNQANTQTQKDANGNLINSQINSNISNLSPYSSTGQNALYSLASLYGLPTPGNPTGGGDSVNAAYQAFTNLPAYQFPLQQGNLALERQLNAQGKTQSGAQARETQQFGQGLASQYLMSNYVNPLMSLAQQGQGASTSLVNANSGLTSNLVNANSNLTSGLATNSVNSGNQIGNTYGNLGTAQASGTMGVGNALAGGVNNAGSSLALYSALASNGSSYGGNLPYNSPGTSINGALGSTAYGGITGPQPLVAPGA